MKEILITGATGFLGSNLVKRLVQEGDCQIRALVRSSSNTDLIDNLVVQKILGDVRDKDSIYRAMKGVDLVYHLAGVVTDWASKNLYYDVHVIGTKNILQIAHEMGIQRVVHISTIDVIAKHQYYEPLTDEHPYCDSSIPYIQTKILAEKIAFKFYREKKLPVCIIRPSWIYGPGDRTLFPELAYQVKKDGMVFIGDAKNYIPLVYIDNLVDVLLLSGEKPEAVGHAFIISDSELMTWKDLAEIITHAVEGKRGTFTIPYHLAYFAAVLFELFGKIRRQKNRPLLTRSVIEMMGKSILLDTQKAKSVLGYQQRVSLDDGLKKSIQWLQTVDINKIRVK